jgi:hypothetical protein
MRRVFAPNGIPFFEDDMTKFFVGRSPFEVSAADVWRWRACCRAMRELDGEI